MAQTDTETDGTPAVQPDFNPNPALGTQTIPALKKDDDPFKGAGDFIVPITLADLFLFQLGLALLQTETQARVTLPDHSSEERKLYTDWLYPL